MEFPLVIIISLAVFAALVVLAAETIRQFRRMDKKTSDYTGSDRLAGSAE
jgi:hypothetical protein